MNEYSVESLIPHRGKMRLIDEILEINPTERLLISQVVVTKQDIFFDHTINGVPAYVSFEYMAQSISALSAITDKREKPKPGVILSVSNLSCTQDIFSENTQIRIQVKESYAVGGLFTFDCTASIQGEIVVSCTLMVMETESLENLIKLREGQ